MSEQHFDVNRTVAAPDPSSDPSTQDLDPAISPAPNDQPNWQSAKAKDEAVQKSLTEGVFVTVQRVGAINGRTHTGVLHEVEDGKYAVRTGQPGRPVVLSLDEMETVTVSEAPPTTAGRDY